MRIRRFARLLEIDQCLIPQIQVKNRLRRWLSRRCRRILFPKIRRIPFRIVIPFPSQSPLLDLINPDPGNGIIRQRRSRQTLPVKLHAPNIPAAAEPGRAAASRQFLAIYRVNIRLERRRQIPPLTPFLNQNQPPPVAVSVKIRPQQRLPGHRRLIQLPVARSGRPIHPRQIRRRHRQYRIIVSPFPIHRRRKNLPRPPVCRIAAVYRNNVIIRVSRPIKPEPPPLLRPQHSPTLRPLPAQVYHRPRIFPQRITVPRHQ